LENAINKLEDSNKDKIVLNTPKKSEVSVKPEAIDDFFRNFLVRLNLMKTLNQFQNEWYEFIQTGKLNYEEAGPIPDIYSRNQQLNDRLKFLQLEVDRFKNAATKAKEEYVKMRKERDYHRMHHNRVAQEKNKLITDIKRLKTHYESYDPLLKTLKTKYEGALRDKVVNQMDRDRAVAELKSIKNSDQQQQPLTSPKMGPTQRRLLELRNEREKTKNEQDDKQNHPKV
jgi:sperm-associated antigen 16 protein